MHKSRIRLLAAAAAVGVSMLIAGPAMAGSITAPPPGFTVPSNGNSASPCCGQITITGSGYAPVSAVSVMICDGTSASLSTWDPNVNCDSGTSPAAAISDASGNVTFAANSARALGFFDGTNPSGTFDCLYPTEADPPDGLPHWGNGTNRRVIIITSNLTQKTSDQALESFVLPTPGTAVPETNYAIMLPIGAVVLLAGGYLVLRRRNRHSSGVAA